MKVLSITACALVAAARVAAADGTGVIAASGDPAQRAAVAHAIAAAIADGAAGQARVVVEDPIARARTAVATGAVPIATLREFRRVREQIDEGWRAYQRVAVDLARSRLAVARNDALALVALPGGAELYADASLRFGVVLAHLGRRDEAQAAFAQALALDPDRPITYAEFPPEIIEAIEAVRAAPPVTRHVRIVTQPPGAELTVDRAELGAGPIEMELAVGQHVIVARAPLHRAAAQAIAVAGGDHSAGASDAPIELDLDDDIAATRLDGGARLGLPAAGTQELVDATLQFADLDDAVIAVATERRGEPTLIVQRCAGTPARCTAPSEVGYGDAAGLAAAARAAWASVRGGELREAPSAIGEPGAHGVAGGETRCNACRSPWLWGGVGAAVVGAIVLIVVETAGHPAPTVGIDPNQFGQR